MRKSPLEQKRFELFFLLKKKAQQREKKKFFDGFVHCRNCRNYWKWLDVFAFKFIGMKSSLRLCEA